MFEDSTFESMGRIHTRSRGWMIATFAFNSSILLALIFIPLIYPEALPRLATAILMVAPATPVEETKPVVRPEHAPAMQREIQGGTILAPSKIPKGTYIPGKPEEPARDTVVALSDGGPGGPNNPFSGQGTHPDVRPAVAGTRHVSSGVMDGHADPQSRSGVSADPARDSFVRDRGFAGHDLAQRNHREPARGERAAMLQQAAKDAVSQWRYRPYLLNGEPVEVETTVNVEFRLD